MSYSEIREDQKQKQKLGDFPGNMGDDGIFAKYNYCNFSQMISGNDTEVCWYVHLDAAFFGKVISMGLIATFGILGNFLLALTILSSKRLSSKSVNFFIVVLSISNILSEIIEQLADSLEDKMEVISTEDFTELKRVVLDEAMKTTRQWRQPSAAA